MADITSSAVTVLASWREGGPSGKERVVKRLKIALTGQGGLLNKIPASALGLKKIEDCSNAYVELPPTVVPTALQESGLYLLLCDLTQSTDADRGLPADVGYTIVVTVKGYD